MSKINNPNTRLPFYIKIVCPQFTETKGMKEQKVINLEEQADKEYKLELVKSKVGETFGKLCGSTCMRIVKEILLEK